MTDAPDRLRVSVVGGDDRVDLVVPAAVSVAELLPELLLRLGEGDPLAQPGEARLAVVGGPPLEAAVGLAAQGVPDGALLTVTTEIDQGVDERPAVDDLTAVVAEVVEAVPGPAPGAGRWSGLVVASALLALAAAVGLALATPLAAVLSGVVSALLLALAAVTVRVDGPPAIGAAAGWLAVTHAGVAGLGLGAGAVGVGAGWVVSGAGAALASGRRRSPLWSAAIAGLVLGVAGAVAALTPAPVPLVLTCALVGVVVTGDLQAWLVATLVGLVVPPLGEEPPVAPDVDAVAGAVRRAHDLLLVGSLATGLLLAVVGPVVAVGGAWSAALVLICCAVVALRSRRQRVGAGGLVGLLGATVPVLPVAVTVGVTRPDWRLGIAVAAGCVGLLGLALVALPARRSPRAGRVAELAEALALVALPPVLLVATDLLGRVRELVG